MKQVAITRCADVKEGHQHTALALTVSTYQWLMHLSSHCHITLCCWEDIVISWAPWTISINWRGIFSSPCWWSD